MQRPKNLCSRKFLRVRKVFARMIEFCWSSGINQRLSGRLYICFDCLTTFQTVSKVLGYFQMVSKLSRRFQNCRDLSGWLKNLPDGCTTGRIFSDGHKIIRTVSKLMGYFQMISNFPAKGFKIDRMVPDLFKISFGWRTMITLLRLCREVQLRAFWACHEKPIQTKGTYGFIMTSPKSA